MVSLATMLRFPAAAACGLLLAACGSSITLPIGTPTPSANPADSPAAALRVRIDLLFGEHVYTIGKLSLAAVAGRKDEFHSYATLLALNGGDVTTLMRSALGETQGTQLGGKWTQGNNLYVDYMVAAVTHDKAKADAAMASLTGTYVPAMAQLLEAGGTLSQDAATTLAGDQVSGLKLVMDDAVAGTFAKLYADLLDAYAKATGGGDALAAGIVGRFADRFPGDPKSKAAGRRTSLNTLLQQQAYVMTMTSGAAVLGASAELNAATDALTAIAMTLQALDARVGRLLNDEASLLIDYAKSGDGVVRQAVIDDAGPNLTAGLTAVLQVIDDQRGKHFDKVAVDDRVAALLLAAAGDAMA